MSHVLRMKSKCKHDQVYGIQKWMLARTNARWNPLVSIDAEAVEIITVGAREATLFNCEKVFGA